MTRAARIVLQDAQFAIARHDETLQSEEFRASWFTVVGLLRAVGHVLAKVDSLASDDLRVAIEQQWQKLCASRPEPVIFWGFIESERNRLLKSYENSIKRTITLPSLIQGIRVVSDRGRSRGSQLNPGTRCESVIASGPFAGKNEKEVAVEALRWWASYLDEVDAVAAARGAI